jgi:putative endonuclease
VTWERLRLGEEGEGLAARFLEERGYRIVARRWREIDLVAKKGGVVAFVEVKTRRDPLTPPVLAVDHRKRHQLAAAARLAAVRWPAREFRFDVVSVVMEKGGVRVEHLADAFRLGD